MVGSIPAMTRVGEMSWFWLLTERGNWLFAQNGCIIENMYTHQTVENFAKERLLIRQTISALTDEYFARNFRTRTATDYARYGFLRRLQTLVRCVDNVFRILPPDRIDIPSSEETGDGIINIQAFVFNLFGCLDNLARIWVEESSLRKKDGSEFPDAWIGMGPKNTDVRSSFSTDFQDYLKNFDKWFVNLENFRHALAHRKPLYVPPFNISPKNYENYRSIDIAKHDALISRNRAEYDRLRSEQRSLTMFLPVISGSIDENSLPIQFHPQLLSDLKTIENIGRRLLTELDRASSERARC